MMECNILIAGVGGQGTLLTSRILGAWAQGQQLDTKISEVHGMAQRGGSVVTHVRVGRQVYSPRVEPGEADYILAFEEVEAMRVLPYLKRGGKLVVNAQQIAPMPVNMGVAKYPADALERLRGRADVLVVDALKEALACGNAKAVNVVMVGVLAKRMGTELEPWREAVRTCVPAKFLEVNLKAIEAGYALG